MRHLRAGIASLLVGAVAAACIGIAGVGRGSGSATAAAPDATVAGIDRALGIDNLDHLIFIV